MLARFAFVLYVSCLMGHAADADKPVETNTPAVAALDSARVKELWKKLGDDSFEEREKATLELIRMGPAVCVELERLEQDTSDAEVKLRCIKVREALKDVDATGAGVLACIEKSDSVFLRGGKRYSPQKFSTWLQSKAALHNVSLTAPAQEFIDKVASKSVLKGGSYKVVLKDGTEQDLGEWLAAQTKAKAKK